ncbi:MAG: hypothetical protein AAFY35_10820 [Pseudomonadota bacterium]
MLDDPTAPDRHARTPLDDVADHARRVDQMCDLLEALADDLPRRAAPVWREATRMCKAVIPMHYQNILTVVMPVLRRRCQGEVDCENTLRRLQTDFEEEACRLSELNELLEEAMETGGSTIDPEALGFALRGFFGALRRITSWETDVLLPLADRHLNAEDLNEIACNLLRLDRNHAT